MWNIVVIKSLSMCVLPRMDIRSSNNNDIVLGLMFVVMSSRQEICKGLFNSLIIVIILVA